VRTLGIDIGGTHVKAVVIEDGRVVARRETQTLSQQGGPEGVLARVVGLAQDTVAWDSIGVALPGLFDESGRAVLLPNLHGDWAGVAIAEPLASALEGPVRLVNDGHAFALAESTLGAGRDGRTVMCVVCGTGIGGGLVLEGRLHLGPRDRAGEFGHQTVVEDGPPCGCGNRGCLELYAGARAIARSAGRESFREAAGAAHAGDERACAALERAGTLIGRAIANVLIFLCPDRVVVGGGVAEAGELVLGPLRAEVERRARVAPLDHISIVRAALGADAGAIGAALWGATSCPSA
jgi:glucokinase